jgi:two-component system LytT family response regulator
MIKVILIDDEVACLDALEQKLLLLDKDVKIIRRCNNAKDGIEAIELFNPDAVFLDISMPQMDGFTMLQELERINFEIIFCTAHNEHAVKALRLCAFDFLLKPAGMEELEECIIRLKEKIKDKKVNEAKQQQLQNFVHLFREPTSSDAKIVLPSSNGLHFIPVKDIIRAESEGNYTNFFLVNGKKHLVSKTMKEYEEMLSNYNFFRVHKSHMVNMKYIIRYSKGDGGTLVMSDGSEVEVSARKKSELMEKLYNNM